MVVVRKLIECMPRKKAYTPSGDELFENRNPSKEDWSLVANPMLSESDIDQLCHAI